MSNGMKICVKWILCVQILLIIQTFTKYCNIVEDLECGLHMALEALMTWHGYDLERNNIKQSLEHGKLEMMAYFHLGK